MVFIGSSTTKNQVEFDESYGSSGKTGYATKSQVAGGSQQQAQQAGSQNYLQKQFGRMQRPRKKIVIAEKPRGTALRNNEPLEREFSEHDSVFDNLEPSGKPKKGFFQRFKSAMPMAEKGVYGRQASTVERSAEGPILSEHDTRAHEPRNGLFGGRWFASLRSKFSRGAGGLAAGLGIARHRLTAQQKDLPQVPENCALDVMRRNHKIMREGYLMKEGRYLKSRLKKRYFMLTTDNAMVYLKKPESSKETGRIHLAHVTGIEARRGKNKARTFEMVLKGRANDVRFYAPNEQEQREWVEWMQAARSQYYPGASNLGDTKNCDRQDEKSCVNKQDEKCCVNKQSKSKKQECGLKQQEKRCTQGQGMQNQQRLGR